MLNTCYPCHVLIRLEFFVRFSTNPEVLNFKKVRPMGDEQFHADGRTQRRKDIHTCMTKLIFTFRNFVNAPTSTYFKKRDVLLVLFWDCGFFFATWPVAQGADVWESPTGFIATASRWRLKGTISPVTECRWRLNGTIDPVTDCRCRQNGTIKPVTVCRWRLNGTIYPLTECRCRLKDTIKPVNECRWRQNGTIVPVTECKWRLNGITNPPPNSIWASIRCFLVCATGNFVHLMQCQ
jgi:hypothetical protein